MLFFERWAEPSRVDSSDIEDETAYRARCAKPLPSPVVPYMGSPSVAARLQSSKRL